MAPPACSSLYVELSEREGEVPSELILRELARMGAITSPGDLRFMELRSIEHAYVVFDDAHGAATQAVLGWLESVGIHSCGRYGSWVYNAMEDSMLQGRSAAHWAMNRTGDVESE